jgi:hypothetical protein
MRSIFFGLLTSTFLAIVSIAGCSSSTTCPKGEVCTAAGSGSPSATSGTSSSGVIIHRFNDGGTEASVSSLVPDGTTGIPCTKDSDCIGEGGAGVNRCSSDYQFMFTGIGVSEFASPVCIVPPAAGGNCDPGTDPTQIQFCDSPDPNDPSSPGVCVPLNAATPMTGQGVCLPKCTFAIDGSAAVGCSGHNGCSFDTYIIDNSAKVTGIGLCQSTCRTKADCAALGATYDCQVDIGECSTAPIATRKKSIGDVCTSADTTAGNCFCATGTGTTGFCTADCVIGATPSDCPVGWVCDTGEPLVLDFGPGEPMSMLTKQTAGALGICLPTCTSSEAGAPVPVVEAGGGTSEGGVVEASAPPAACPGSTSLCNTADIAGFDCVPQ